MDLLGLEGGLQACSSKMGKTFGFFRIFAF